MQFNFNIRHAFVIGIASSKKCFSIIDEIYNETKLDGIECYYTTFSKKQTEKLLDFARRKNLLISGGSDYHGLNKKQHDLGIGRGNLKINKDNISNWNIKYYNN